MTFGELEELLPEERSEWNLAHKQKVDTFMAWKAAMTKVARCKREESLAAAREACTKAESDFRAAAAVQDELSEVFYARIVQRRGRSKP